MFIFSHSIYCFRCGGSNREFLKQKEPRCKSGWTVKRICRECVNENRRISRKASGELRTEKRREYQRQYRVKNREKVMEWSREYSRRRRKNGKPFLTIKKIIIWYKYGSCSICKKTTLPHFAKGKCKPCYYRIRARIDRIRKRLKITGPLPKYLKLGNV